jgi:hypothetical protein
MRVPRINDGSIMEIERSLLLYTNKAPGAEKSNKLCTGKSNREKCTLDNKGIRKARGTR